MDACYEVDVCTVLYVVRRVSFLSQASSDASGKNVYGVNLLTEATAAACKDASST